MRRGQRDGRKVGKDVEELEESHEVFTVPLSEVLESERKGKESCKKGTYGRPM